MVGPKETIDRAIDWIVFILRLLPRVGGPGAWLTAINRLATLLRSRSEDTRKAAESLEAAAKFQPGEKAFYETNDFPLLADLEANWDVIYQELANLRGEHFIDWSERYLYKDGWTTFGLYAYGIAIGKNCALCPKTTQLIEKIPHLMTAGFSSLAPGTHISPHTGYPEGVLRCHLGLVIPDENPEVLALRVGDQLRPWQTGKCLVFDDTLEHEAWNRSDRTRIVMLLDFHP
jgi:ornithine lipid ester-linked acyl 2-hydroxylase